MQIKDAHSFSKMGFVHQMSTFDEGLF